MKNHKSLHLNLASHPARNRRLFFSSIALLSLVILLIAFIGGGNFLRYGNKVRINKATVRQLDQSIRTAEREEGDFKRRTNTAARELGKEVETLNGIIYRKSFSWVRFLSVLEEVLPDACYIVSLAPVFREDASVDLNFKMVSPDSENFYTLLERIVERGGRDVRLIREDRDQRGNLIFEISVIYARDN
jgi:hypothetical protein